MYLSLTVLTLLGSATAHKFPNFAENHDAIVHLFEWKYADIAHECENFLGPIGYGGVQVSPIQENVIVPSRPWWERYQPISYAWNTRSGDESSFRDMVRRCNAAGVRIYVDAITNHMAADNDKAVGTGGNTADISNLYYGAVPYSAENFHRPCAVNDYNNAENVRNCELVGLHDLDQSQDYVRGKIIDFLNAAIDAGVAGFRIDAAKHMWPADIEYIIGQLHDLNTEHGFPRGSRPYIYQEVIDCGSEAVSKTEYNSFAAVTEFSYGAELSKALRGNNALKYMYSWGEQWNMLPSEDALVFIDNHDNQRGYDNVLTYKESRLYKMAVAFMLAHPYGTPKIMSSFAFENNFDQGPPADENGNIISPVIEENICTNGWICEHRWSQIFNMVGFRNTVRGTKVTNWWDNGNNQIAFCRGNAGFIAINNDNHDLNQTLQTCLPQGIYCDVISGGLQGGRCTGKSVIVRRDGTANISLRTSESDGVLAIHVKDRQ